MNRLYSPLGMAGPRQRFVAASNATFVISGDEPPDDSLLLGAGLSYHRNASVSCSIRYDGVWDRAR